MRHAASIARLVVDQVLMDALCRESLRNALENPIAKRGTRTAAGDRERRAGRDKLGAAFAGFYWAWPDFAQNDINTRMFLRKSPEDSHRSPTDLS